MLNITDLFLCGGRTRPDIRYCLTDSPAPEFAWSLEGSDPCQRAFRIRVLRGDLLLWDTGRVSGPEQKAVYAGEPLPGGAPVTAELTVWDAEGEASLLRRSILYAGSPGEAQWIKAAEPSRTRAVYFRKEIRLADRPLEACLYVCGLGYHHVLVNGFAPDDSLLQPSHTNYAKTACFSVKPVAGLLKAGANSLTVIVAEGWRSNASDFTRQAVGDREPEFFGPVMLWARLEVLYPGGGREAFATDGSWTCSFGSIVSTGIFRGEDYDAGFSDVPKPAEVCPGPGGRLVPDILEPIRPVRELSPVCIFRREDGSAVLDFGENIAGVLRVPLGPMKKGQRIRVRYAEELREDGTLFREPLRGAAAEDTYTASGDGRDPALWQPLFTYHGFRYASLEGLKDCGGVKAVEVHSDLRNKTVFRCGSSLVNKIWEAAVRTDANNIHSIMTDCPQRDERMGWMNDATGRFTVSPYAFDTGRLFPKIVRDIRNEQRPEGQFTCCCPYYFGMLPADPVCSAYLTAVSETLMHTGDRGFVRRVIGDLEHWEDYLLSRSPGYITDYSWYGDWAGPSYACMGEEQPQNRHTEGILVSTGFSLYNCRLLESMARAAGLPWEKYAENGTRIRDAMLDRWYDGGAVFAGGSMGAQALALWLDILPEENRAAAAAYMAEDLRGRDHAITTGNQLTLVLLEMLCEYGFVDDAWAFLTREEYPSFGYMLQNEATTIWERYELKKDPGMNSHSHPMHANALRILYSRIAGLVPAAPGWERVRIKPCMPSSLLSCRLTADTVRGAVTVGWAKRFGRKILQVQLPPGVKGSVEFEGVKEDIGPGFRVFEV
ncbi:MAG: family 78 glycoside hydrolase catalytic domain [Abditibacteriota bacterium]|nr:family 78 glycoside hydrolase catalytic domain [Abditibacteriota bacterium]